MFTPTMSAGIRSGVNWMRWNWPRMAIDKVPHQQRFGRARRTFQEDVSAGQEGHDRLIQHGVHADDHLLQFSPNGRGCLGHRFKFHVRVPPQHGEVR